MGIQVSVKKLDAKFTWKREEKVAGKSWRTRWLAGRGSGGKIPKSVRVGKMDEVEEVEKVESSGGGGGGGDGGEGLEFRWWWWRRWRWRWRRREEEKKE
ncbi:hypothetical protein Pcinc_040593 [Petrolisthes cinctipes]|uniref:Uncharacterized protein n=1 Tax=Petrolisthes cinctipes TaxID=88211 RepID=A0AAE1BL50_PETCI|nr:hypothetical protein Pcinc_040593 [Petrolisthes cinctipes]